MSPKPPNIFQMGPVDPREFEGPFTDVLTQPAPRQEPRIRGVQPGTTTALMMGQKFLEGAAQARIRNFQMEENQKFQKVQDLIRQSQVLLGNQDMTPDAQQFVQQKIVEALGGHIVAATDGIDRGKGKSGKKGWEDSSKGPGMGGHIASMFREIAIGATGGKLKGAKDIGDPHAIIGQIHAELTRPENLRKYSREANVEALAAQLQQGLSGLPANAPYEKASAVAAPIITQMLRFDPQRAQVWDEFVKRRFPHPSPAPGKPAFEAGMYQFLGNTLGLSGGATPPPPRTGAQTAPSGSPDDLRQQIERGRTPSGERPAEAPVVEVGANRSGVANRLMAWEAAGFAKVDRPQYMEVIGTDGKGTQQGMYRSYSSPEGQGWLDENNLPVPHGVRLRPAPRPVQTKPEILHNHKVGEDPHTVLIDPSQPGRILADYGTEWKPSRVSSAQLLTLRKDQHYLDMEMRYYNEYVSSVKRIDQTRDAEQARILRSPDPDPKKQEQLIRENEKARQREKADALSLRDQMLETLASKYGKSGSDTPRSGAASTKVTDADLTLIGK